MENDVVQLRLFAALHFLQRTRIVIYVLRTSPISSKQVPSFFERAFCNQVLRLHLPDSGLRSSLQGDLLVSDSCILYSNGGVFLQVDGVIAEIRSL